jgi:hypothetical protein
MMWISILIELRFDMHFLLAHLFPLHYRILFPSHISEHNYKKTYFFEYAVSFVYLVNPIDSKH